MVALKASISRLWGLLGEDSPGMLSTSAVSSTLMMWLEVGRHWGWVTIPQVTSTISSSVAMDGASPSQVGC